MYYFIVNPKVDQRAGQLCLLHIRIINTEKNRTSAVTETVVFRQNRGEPKPRFFLSQVNTVLPSDVCVHIWYKANELVQARRPKVPSKSSASAKFTYLIPEQLCTCFESAS